MAPTASGSSSPSSTSSASAFASSTPAYGIANEFITAALLIAVFSTVFASTLLGHGLLVLFSEDYIEYFVEQWKGFHGKNLTSDLRI